MKVDVSRLYTEMCKDKLSQSKLAGNAGLHPNTIYRVACGRMARRGTIKKIADALGVSIGYLVAEEADAQ